MASEGQASRLEAEPGGGQLWPGSLWLIVPSWMASLLLHAVVCILLATTMKSCGDGSAISGDGSGRDIGILLQNGTGPEDFGTGELSIDQPAAPAVQAAPALKDVLDALAKTALLIQKVDLPVNDSTVVVQEQAAQTQEQASQNGGGAGGTGGNGLGSSGGGLGPGETSFFGIRDKGARFVYLLDSSGSMLTNDAIDFAKAELIASFQSLDETQQFQVIFYNDKPWPMSLTAAVSDGMYRGTDGNRDSARQYVVGVDVAGGTNHIPALAKALSLKPEVVFFLTDAGPPILRASDLEEIRRLNKAKTRINCIEFGRGPELESEISSLKTLSRQSGGRYRYRDVLQFKKGQKTGASE